MITSRPRTFLRIAALLGAGVVVLIIGFKTAIQLRSIPAVKQYPSAMPEDLRAFSRDSGISNFTRIEPLIISPNSKPSREDLNRIRRTLAWNFLWPRFAERIEVINDTNVVAVCHSSRETTKLIYLEKWGDNWVVVRESRSVNEPSNP